MSLQIPVNHSVAYVAGVADTVATVVPSILADDLVLAVITVGPVTSVDGHDVTDYTVADGTITGATIDNTGLKLMVIHTNAPA
jgi:hypothetical protein